jgi:GxxExxY protein
LGLWRVLPIVSQVKSVEAVAPVHKKQLPTYLRLADKRLGLWINFGSELIRDGMGILVTAI